MAEIPELDDIDDDEVCVVCMPYRRNNTDIVAGSKTSYCEECQTEVHIAPTSMAMIANNPNTRFIINCPACAIKRGDLTEEIHIAPGGNEEIRKKLESKE